MKIFKVFAAALVGAVSAVAFSVAFYVRIFFVAATSLVNWAVGNINGNKPAK